MDIARISTSLGLIDALRPSAMGRLVPSEKSGVEDEAFDDEDTGLTPFFRSIRYVSP